MKLTKEQLSEIITTIYARMAEGMLDDEIMIDTGLPVDEYKKLKAAMFDAKADEVRARPTEHVYVQYMIDQAQNVKALTGMIDEFKNSKQYNAMVGAIKARSDIYDKLIEKGQTFGLIHQEPNKSLSLSGHIVADMTNKQLKTMITGELEVLSKLMRRYGDKSILDVSPGTLHHGPKVAGVIADSAVTTAIQKDPTKNKNTKSTKSKNHRRSGGRKVVKMKAR